MVNENQEDFEKKKKIIVISLSVSLVFITLIAGLFLAKKNKESRENNDIGEVVDENDSDQEDNDDDDYENDDVIVNEGDYFFNKTSGRVTMNILLFLVAGILFFLWENDKLPHNDKAIVNEGCEMTTLSNSLCGVGHKRGIGIFDLDNWLGVGTLLAIIITTLLVEFILQLLLGSVSYFLSKDKNKKYLRTLKMLQKKRKQLLFSFSKTKIFFIVLTYLLCAFVIAMIARIVERCHPCCLRHNGQIISYHGLKCYGFCEEDDDLELYNNGKITKATQTDPTSNRLDATSMRRIPRGISREISGETLEDKRFRQFQDPNQFRQYSGPQGPLPSGYNPQFQTGAAHGPQYSQLGMPHGQQNGARGYVGLKIQSEVINSQIGGLDHDQIPHDPQIKNEEQKKKEEEERKKKEEEQRKKEEEERRQREEQEKKEKEEQDKIVKEEEERKKKEEEEKLKEEQRKKEEEEAAKRAIEEEQRKKEEEERRQREEQEKKEKEEQDKIAKEEEEKLKAEADKKLEGEGAGAGDNPTQNTEEKKEEENKEEKK